MKRMAMPRHIGRKHPDLAVGDLARRAGVLPRHPAGRLALLEEAGFVDDQHRVRVGQRLERVVAHHVAQAIRVPASAAQHRLLAPGAGIARGLGAHPAGFAPLGAQQPVEEARGRAAPSLLLNMGRMRALAARSDDAHSSSVASIEAPSP